MREAAVVNQQIHFGIHLPHLPKRIKEIRWSSNNFWQKARLNAQLALGCCLQQTWEQVPRGNRSAAAVKTHIPMNPHTF